MDFDIYFKPSSLESVNEIYSNLFIKQLKVCDMHASLLAQNTSNANFSGRCEKMKCLKKEKVKKYMQLSEENLYYLDF